MSAAELWSAKPSYKGEYNSESQDVVREFGCESTPTPTGEARDLKRAEALPLEAVVDLIAAVERVEALQVRPNVLVVRQDVDRPVRGQPGGLRKPQVDVVLGGLVV